MIRLPSRASAPDHCAECDGDRDLPGPLCSECADATLLERIEWRYQNGEGIVYLREGERWSIEREFHPLHWGLGLSVEIGSSGLVLLSLGPWSIWVAWHR